MSPSGDTKVKPVRYRYHPSKEASSFFKVDDALPSTVKPRPGLLKRMNEFFLGGEVGPMYIDPRSKIAPFMVATALFSVGIIWVVWSNMRQEREPKVLSEERFIKLPIIGVRKLTEDVSVFSLSLPKQVCPIPKGETGHEPVHTVWIAEDEQMIQRPYTPLNSACFDPLSNDQKIDVLVRKYEDGEVSKWIHRMASKPSPKLSVRGPVQSWRCPDVKEVVFIVGGTGITPAYQVISHHLLPTSQATGQKTTGPRFKLIYASKRPSQILLKAELDALSKSFPDRLELHYLVDSLDAGQAASTLGIDKVGLITANDLTKWVGKPRSHDSAIVVCGPDGMVAAIAGPRPREALDNPTAAFPIGGYLAALGWTANTVTRLDSLERSTSRKP